MKKRKSVLLFILSALLFVSLGAAGCAGGNNDKNSSSSNSISSMGALTIENFEDLTVTAGYNTEFSLAQYITAVDNTGMGHKCQVSVKNSAGENVEVNFNTFSVTSTENYTANCFIDFEGKRYERTITIQVVDNSAPKLTIGELKTGFTSEAYELPQVSAEKALGEKITPSISVYYVDRVSLEEQTVENNMFTPTKAGNYRLVATAEDSLGNVGTATVEFLVRTGMSGEMLEDFTDSLSALNVTSTTNGGVWYNSVTLDGETRNGVVKTETTNVYKEDNPTNGNFNMFRIKFNRSVEQLEKIGEDFDYISMKVYVETEQQFTDDQVRFYSWAVSTAPFQLNKWQTVIFTKDMIAGTNGESYWSNDNKKESNAGLYDNAIDYFWNVHGEDGTNATPIFQLKGLTSPATVYIDEIAVVRASVEAFDAPTGGDEFKVPTVSLRGVDGSVVATSTKDSTEVLYRVNTNATAVPVAINGDGKIAVKSGNHDVNYSLKVGENVYSKSISFFANRKAMSANMLEDFNDETSLDNVINPNYSKDTTLEKWHSEYDGHTGVAQISAKGSQVDLKFNRSLAELKAIDFDYITVNMYVDVNWILVNTQIFGVVKKLQNKQWIDVTVTKEEIIAAYGSTDAFFEVFANEGTGRRFAYNNCSEATFYIDSVSFGKN